MIGPAAALGAKVAALETFYPELLGMAMIAGGALMIVIALTPAQTDVQRHARVQSR